MSGWSFALFDTPIGPCAIVWSARGIAGIQLPEGRPVETRARVVERFLDARESPAPAQVSRAIADIVALLAGQGGNLTDVVLDMDGIAPFSRRVYEAARAIPPGATASYGELAERMGAKGAARAVGRALGRNPFPIVVPCHRVLAAGDRVGGFTAPGGVATKLRLLSIEAAGNATSTPFDGDGSLGFDPAAAIAHLESADPTLARLIHTVGAFRMQLQRTPSVFAALAQAIVYQQLTGKAAAAIYARLCALFPRAHHGPSAEHILRAPDAKLRSAGLSRSKVLSLRDLARRAALGEIPTLTEIHGMESEAVVEQLTEVRGIGRWTVEMLLIFRLGRPDVLPIDDYGVRKGYAFAYKKRELPKPKDLERYGARWKPYRTVASWYLWRAAELAARAQKGAAPA